MDLVSKYFVLVLSDSGILSNTPLSPFDEWTMLRPRLQHSAKDTLTTTAELSKCIKDKMLLIY